MSGPKPKAFTVGKGRNALRIAPWKNAAGKWAWRFISPIDGRHIRRVSVDNIRSEAQKHLRALTTGRTTLANITPEQEHLLGQILQHLPTETDLRQFLQHLEHKRRALTIRELAAEFIEHKRHQKGHLSQHLRSVQKDHDHLVQYFPRKTLAELSIDHLRDWHSSRVGSAGPKRQNDCRTNLLALYNHALRMDHIDAATHRIAARLPIAHTPQTLHIRYADRSETLFLLKHVSEKYRLWLILGLFAGLRPEEIIPEKNRRRRGLLRHEIDLETKTIYISPEVAGKTGFPRRIPITPALKHWLHWAGWVQGQRGPISERTAARAEETLRLGKLLDQRNSTDTGWPQDILRHTYASHRHAVLQNIHQLAEELGNSPAIIRKHYNQPLPKQQGKDFFNLRPKHLEEETIIDGHFKTGTD